MGVQRREEAKPTIPKPANSAKVLIPINRAAEVYPNHQALNTQGSQKTPKNPSRPPTIKNFIFRRTNGEPGVVTIGTRVYVHYGQYKCST